MGTNNIMPKAQRNKAQRSFQPVKAQRKMRKFIFLTSEAQRNFRNELFCAIEAQHSSAMFQNKKLMRNATSAIAEVALCPPLQIKLLCFSFS